MYCLEKVMRISSDTSGNWVVRRGENEKTVRKLSDFDNSVQFSPGLNRFSADIVDRFGGENKMEKIRQETGQNGLKTNNFFQIGI